MSDQLTPPQPTGEFGDLPYELSPSETEWMHRAGEEKVHLRFRGLDVLHRSELGLPLSPLEEAVFELVKDDSNWQEEHDDELRDRIMADRIGTKLTATKPEKPMFYDDPELRKAIDTSTYDLYQLSDDRPPEAKEQ